MQTIKKILLAALLITILQGCSSKHELPGKIYELDLVNKVTGKQAAEIIDGLHMQPVATISNQIGYYEGRRGSAVVYISEYPAGKDAEDAYERMLNKIMSGQTPFFSGEYNEIEGTQLFRCFGMGQTHYIFFKKAKLFWVAADTHLARNFISDYL